jgi:hypothetical protein
VPAAAVPADSVAVAWPWESVVAEVTATAPAEAEKVMLTFAIATLFESSAVAVRVATAVPLLDCGTCDTLLVSVMVARPAVLPPPPVVLQVAKSPQPLPPPQLPSAANATEAKTHFKIRMFIT